ncbi:MAG: O-antigen ligase family protein [Verrucomicrobiae bacterium]|nr:O-antigen ligase family protein [Verrucomicrobiae bacterium]
MVYLKDSIRWLPHTYDRTATLGIFAQYVGLAFAFWGIRDWLLSGATETSRESSGADEAGPAWARVPAKFPIPPRVRQLLWILCLNGVALALVCVVQRAAGSNRLLFFMGTLRDNPAELVFGPWPYRSNAAQYFNLLWPLCIGFWVWVQELALRSSDPKVARYDGPQIVLLPCALMLAAMPTLSGSRASAAVSVMMVAGVIAVLILASRHQFRSRVRGLALGCLLLAGLGTFVVGGGALRERLVRPDVRHSTGQQVGTGPFSVLTRLTIPEVRQGERRNLVYFAGPLPGGNQLENYFSISMDGQGQLIGLLRGSSSTNASWKVVPGFAEGFTGRQVTLAAVRDEGLRLYADGVLLAGAPERPDPRVPQVYVDSANVYLADPSISEVALFGGSLDDAELRRATEGSMTEFARDYRAIPPIEMEGEELVAALAVPDGVSLQSPDDGRTAVITRVDEHGLLGFRWMIPAGESRHRSIVRVDLDIENPSSQPITLALVVDGGYPTLLDLDPGRADELSAICWIPHTGAPGYLDVVAHFPDGQGPVAMEPGTSFLVHRISMASAVPVFHLALHGGASLEGLLVRMSGRPEVYRNARRLAADFVWWGSGAGSFASMYGLYRQAGEGWAAYAHNDWLEVRATMGWLGLALLVVALAIFAVRSCTAGSRIVPSLIVGLIWVSLAGCLVNAIGDYPFQIYSVVFLFVVLVATLMSLITVRPAPGATA